MGLVAYKDEKVLNCGTGSFKKQDALVFDTNQKKIRKKNRK